MALDLTRTAFRIVLERQRISSMQYTAEQGILDSLSIEEFRYYHHPEDGYGRTKPRFADSIGKNTPSSDDRDSLIEYLRKIITESFVSDDEGCIRIRDIVQYYRIDNDKVAYFGTIMDYFTNCLTKNLLKQKDTPVTNEDNPADQSSLFATVCTILHSFLISNAHEPRTIDYIAEYLIGTQYRLVTILLQYCCSGWSQWESSALNNTYDSSTVENTASTLPWRMEKYVFPVKKVFLLLRVFFHITLQGKSWARTIMVEESSYNRFVDTVIDHIHNTAIPDSSPQFSLPTFDTRQCSLFFRHFLSSSIPFDGSLSVFLKTVVSVLTAIQSQFRTVLNTKLKSRTPVSKSVSPSGTDEAPALPYRPNVSDEIKYLSFFQPFFSSVTRPSNPQADPSITRVSMERHHNLLIWICYDILRLVTEAAFFHHPLVGIHITELLCNVQLPYVSVRFLALLRPPLLSSLSYRDGTEVYSYEDTPIFTRQRRITKGIAEYVQYKCMQEGTTPSISSFVPNPENPTINNAHGLPLSSEAEPSASITSSQPHVQSLLARIQKKVRKARQTAEIQKQQQRYTKEREEINALYSGTDPSMHEENVYGLTLKVLRTNETDTLVSTMDLVPKQDRFSALSSAGLRSPMTVEHSSTELQSSSIDGPNTKRIVSSSVVPSSSLRYSLYKPDKTILPLSALAPSTVPSTSSGNANGAFPLPKNSTASPRIVPRPKLDLSLTEPLNEITVALSSSTISSTTEHSKFKDKENRLSESEPLSNTSVAPFVPEEYFQRSVDRSDDDDVSSSVVQNILPFVSPDKLTVQHVLTCGAGLSLSEFQIINQRHSVDEHDRYLHRYVYAADHPSSIFVPTNSSHPNNNTIVHPLFGSVLSRRQSLIFTNMFELLYLICHPSMYRQVTYLVRLHASIPLTIIASSNDIPLIVEPVLRILKDLVRHLGAWKRNNMKLITAIYHHVPTVPGSGDEAWTETPSVIRLLRSSMMVQPSLENDGPQKSVLNEGNRIPLSLQSTGERTDETINLPVGTNESSIKENQQRQERLRALARSIKEGQSIRSFFPPPKKLTQDTDTLSIPSLTMISLADDTTNTNSNRLPVATTTIITDDYETLSPSSPTSSCGNSEDGGSFLTAVVREPVIRRLGSFSKSIEEEESDTLEKWKERIENLVKEAEQYIRSIYP